MLPGFRFLFAAIVLSLSALVFGLGAAALLRAAHEQFASMPTRRAPPEAVFAQHSEPAPPVLALLRVDAPPAAVAKPDVADSVAARLAMIEPARTALEAANTETARIETTKIETTRIEATRIEATKTETAGTEIIKPETPAQETAPQSAPITAQADAPAPPDTTKIAALEAAPSPPAESVARAVIEAAAEPPGAAPSPQADTAATKTAALDGSPVAVETPAAKTAKPKPDQSAIRKRQKAKREARRRRLAARARLTQQMPTDPFAPQPTIAFRKR